MAKKPGGSMKGTALRWQAEERFRATRRDVAFVAAQKGQPVTMRRTLYDITARKQMEGELATQQALLGGIIESAMDAIITVDAGEQVVVFNRAAESMFLCQGAAAIGEPLDRFIPERFRQADHSHARAFARAQMNSGSMGRLGALIGLRANGEKFPIEASFSHIRVNGKHLSTVILRDVTERVEMDLELKSLTGKLIDAQEQERRRIARELHDDYNQRLAALSVELESIERAPIALPKPVARQLAAIRAQVVQISDNLHDLAYRLHPSLLDHVSMEVALRDHVAGFTKRTGLPVMFTAREVPVAISQEVTTNLFRVLQESLQNVFKHAKATDVTVRVSGSSKGIGLSVRDNGKGFDLEGKNERVKGLGLVSMKERAHGLGGFLRIRSLAGGGTKVGIWIPHFQEGA